MLFGTPRLLGTPSTLVRTHAVATVAPHLPAEVGTERVQQPKGRDSVSDTAPSPAPSQFSTAPDPRQLPPTPTSGPAQPGRTSAALIAQRAARLKEAQALTISIRDSARWTDLERLFDQHKGRMNHIHMSALMARLAHLGQGTAQSWSKYQAAAVRAFLDTAVPFIGLHLLTLGPRQLATVMWALGSLGYTPQPAWLVEWSACVARKLHAFTPQVRIRSLRTPHASPTPKHCISVHMHGSGVGKQLQVPPVAGMVCHMPCAVFCLRCCCVQDLAMSTWGLVASGAMAHGASSGAPGALLQLVTAAVQPATCAALRPTDVANLLWALGTSRLRPDARVVGALAARAADILRACAGSAGEAPQADAGTAAAPQSAVTAAASSSIVPGPAAYKATSTASQTAPVQAAATAPAGIRTAAARTASQSSFQPQELMTVLWAFAKLAYRPSSALLAAATDAFVAGARSSQAAERAKVRQGQGTGHTGHKAVCVERKNYATVLWALARLRARPAAQAVADLLAGSLQPAGPAQQPAQAARTAAGGGQLSHADLAQIVWSLGRLQYQPSRECWQLLVPAVVSALEATATHAPENWDMPPVKVSRHPRGRLFWSVHACFSTSVHARMAAGTSKRVSRRVLVTDECVGSVLTACGVQEAASSSRHAAIRLRWRLQRWQRRHADQLTDTDAPTPTITYSTRPHSSTTTPRGNIASSATSDDATTEAVPLSAPELLTLLWGLRRLRLLRLPVPLRTSLRALGPKALAAVQAQLGRLPPSAQLDVMTSCALLHVRPPLRFVSAWSGAAAHAAPYVDAERLAAALQALVLVRRRPAPAVLQAAVQRSLQLMQPPAPGPASQSLQPAASPSASTAAPTQAQPSQNVERRMHQVTPMYPVSNDHPLVEAMAASATVQGHNSMPAQVPSQAQAEVKGLGVGVSGGGESTGYQWQGSVASLVRIMWALSELRAGPVGQQWAEGAVPCIARAAPRLRPAELSRVLRALRRLRVRPTRGAYLAAAQRVSSTARVQAAALQCDQPCYVGTELPCHVKACGSLQSVGKQLRLWRKDLAAEERHLYFSRLRLYRQQPQRK